MKMKLFVNTEEISDIIDVQILKQRFYAINGKNEEDFLNYLLDGCIMDGIDKEYLIMNIWTAYSMEADITYIMCEDEEDNLNVINFVWGNIEEDLEDGKNKSVLECYAKRGIIKEYAHVL